jgi:hypothetical protein
MGALPRISNFLLLPALVASSALTLGAVGEGHPDPDGPPATGVVLKTRSFPTTDFGVRRPSGLGWDAGRGVLLVGGPRHDLARAVRPDKTDLGLVRGRDLTPEPPGVVDLAAHDLHGRARQPGTDEVLTFDRTTDRLVAIRGRTVTEAYDASALGLARVTGVVVAPTADATDDPARLSVYLADAGPPDGSGQILEATLDAGIVPVASVTPISVRSVATSSYSPPSPDPSGVAYLPGADRLMIVDGEVDEMAIFDGVNLFATTTAGSLSTTGLSQPWSNEPVGVGYSPDDEHVFVSDDDQKEVFEVVAGSDDRFGTGDDTVTHFDTLGFGNADPEGLDYDDETDSLWIVDGLNAEVYRVRAAADGSVGTGDDTVTHFDVGIFGARDPEGLGYDAERGTVVVVDDASDTIYELDRSGNLLNTINVASANMTAAAGLAVGPASGGSEGRAYYVAARGLDNNSHPGENDGRLYEIRATLPPMPDDPDDNTAPEVDAGPDRTVTLPSAVTLDGSVSDDGRPAPLTTTWLQASGPGTVTFGDATAEDTVATFAAAGSYVLQLTASDGALSVSDTVVVTVQAAATEAVQPVLTARRADGLVPVGATSTITGTLTPSLAGQTVKLQRASGSAWTTVGSRPVAGGATAEVAFRVSSSKSKAVRYRLLAPATGTMLRAASPAVTVRFSKVRIRTVRPGPDEVVLQNVGAVRVDLRGWVLRNKKNGKEADLPSFVLERGAVVHVHTGQGSRTGKHLYLAKRDMWGKHGKAVLRDDGGLMAHRFRY